MKFLADLKERLAKFALELHPDKTRLLAFGRFIAGERRARGEGRPETFDFLGFTHICGVKRSTAGTGRSSFQLLRRTRRRRKWATIRAIKLELQRMRHDPIDEQGRQLASILKGHYAYFAVPTNIDAAYAVRHHVKVRWYLSLRRRSQKRRLSWRRMNVIAEKFLPLPRVLHPWPEQRFLVRHRWQEPDA
jgi:RNA-directed DNA polymerase